MRSSLFTSPRERALWFWASIVATTVFVGLGFSRSLQSIIAGSILVPVFFGVGFLFVILMILTQGLRIRPGGVEIGLVLGIASILLLAFVRLTSPAERTHLVEYAVLALLVHEALIERSANRGTSLAPGLVAFPIVAAIGILDEVVQSAIPNRVFDVRDVLFNILAVGSAILANTSLRWMRKRMHKPLSKSRIKFRKGGVEDLEFLHEMLFEAFHWRPDQARPDPIDFFADESTRKYLANWGRPGDTAVIVMMDERPVGAAWFRLWTDATDSYGFVDSSTPELGLALIPQIRSQGIGRLLLRRLLDEARSMGYSQISLSVEPDNFALKLYQSEGFRRVGESGTSWTLLKEL